MEVIGGAKFSKIKIKVVHVPIKRPVCVYTGYTILGMYGTYLGTVIPSIEKRFGFTSKEGASK